MKQTYLSYHRELAGLNIFKNGKLIPKFIPYHLNIKSSDIINEIKGYTWKRK